MATVGLDDGGTAAVVAALRAGEVVALPTDTVYGVAVALSVEGATDGLFAVKQRPRDVDLPVLVASLDQAESLGELAGRGRSLAERFWPGALTLVVNRHPALTADLGTSTHTVGLRCPDHDWVRRVCAEVGPIATTSANLHGQPPATTAAEVREQLGPDLLVADGGTRAGAPSTVVDATGTELRLLRQGAISWERLTAGD